MSTSETIRDPRTNGEYRIHSGYRYCLASDKTENPVRTKSESKKNTEKEFMKCNILIVEDERLICESLKVQLEEKGHTVVGIADSAEEAIHLVHQTSPDLLIIDIRLKGTIDGIQTALIIHKTIRKIPVIFLTAHSRNQFPHLALIDPSLYLYFTKPFVESDLLKAVQTLKHKVSTSS